MLRLSESLTTIIVLVLGFGTTGMIAILVLKIMNIFKRDVDEKISGVQEKLDEVIGMKRTSNQTDREISTKLDEIQNHLNKNSKI